MKAKSNMDYTTITVLHHYQQGFLSLKLDIVSISIYYIKYYIFIANILIGRKHKLQEESNNDIESTILSNASSSGAVRKRRSTSRSSSGSRSRSSTPRPGNQIRQISNYNILIIHY